MRSGEGVVVVFITKKWRVLSTIMGGWLSFPPRNTKWDLDMHWWLRNSIQTQRIGLLGALELDPPPKIDCSHWSGNLTYYNYAVFTLRIWYVRLCQNFIVITIEGFLLSPINVWACMYHSFYSLATGLPCLPDVVSATSMETTVTILWSFTSMLDTSTETFTVMFGLSSGELGMASAPVDSRPDLQEYSVQLTLLQPGTTYYYQIHSASGFATLQDSLRSIRTQDSSELWNLVVVSRKFEYLSCNSSVFISDKCDINVREWLKPGSQLGTANHT